MSHQDFEKYADEKPFNYKVPEKFKANFDESIKKLGMPPASIKILDFGCGDGKHYNFFISSGLLPANIYGVEVSKKRIERCHSIGWQNAFFIESDKLPFPNNEFDFINIAEVIEHIPAKDAEKIFLDLARVIKKTGSMIITTPNYPIKRLYDFCDAIGHRSSGRLRDDPTHVNFFSTKKLRKFLDRYFNQVNILPYKNGFLFDRCKNNFFMHKMLAICSDKK
jgi:ubiquinone/menaquinone biosynthesis C-methylase UbiE